MPDLSRTVGGERPAAQRRFNFLRWYSAISLICITGVAISAGFFLTQYFKQRMLDRDAVVSMEFINSIVRAQSSWSFFEAAADPSVEARGDVLESFFNYVAHLPAVARANVYAGDRTVLWSSDKEIIGQRFGTNVDLDSALAGRIALDWGVIGDQDKEEHVGFNVSAKGARFVEAYLPIWDRSRVGVIGVVEIYKLPRQLFETIDEGARYIWISGIVGGLLLYASLLSVVRRASGIVREQEARLIEAERFAAIGEMTSAVAHGIRNPLAAIRSSAEVARLEETGEAADECLGDIIAQVDRAERWVGELLAFSRSGDAGEGRTDSERADLRSVADESLASLQNAIERQGITVAVDLARLPPARVNPSQLAQVLGIILTNAVEAMPEGGALTITGSRGSGTIEVSIADTGPGLPAKLAARVFRPFFSTKSNGTGLGLALAQRIIARYGGSLRFISREGHGSTMTVTLPVAASTAANPSLAAATR